MPAEVRAAFNEAQRRLSQSIKTAENPSAESPQVAEQRRKAAAIVISAKTVSADQARKNVVAAYEHQHKAGVDALSSAIDRVKASKTAEPKKDAKAETVSDSKPSLASLLLAAGEE
jgi:riboflavin biosynthesis pyrimidine reductase